ncbi:hypothetical protein [Mycobacterium simiae]
MLQGENADGPTIDENEFPITVADDSPTVSTADRVITAIECTRADAAGAGLELDSIGVAYTDQLEAAVLRDALAAHKIENVMLVSAFVAAAALTQSVGAAMGYERTAVLFVEPDSATLAVVDTADGSVDDVHTEPLDAEWGPMVTAELVALVADLDDWPTPPGGLFVVGADVDVTGMGRCLGEATSLVVNMPEEPETALARGAALASAHALASPTTAMAYAQDPGTGAVDASALPGYLHITDTELSDDGLAYSAVADEEADAATTVINASDGVEPRSRPALLVGTAVAIAGFSAALALEIALSVGMRTTVSSLPAPIKGIIAPVQQALLPAPEVALKMVAPAPLGPASVAPRPVAPAPAAPAVAVPAAPPVAVPAVPAAPVPVAPAAPVPVFVPQIDTAPVPPVHVPAPPASPPVVDDPPHSSPPIHVPPPKSPPHRPPAGQSPPPSSGGGGTQGSGQNPNGGGSVSHPGPGTGGGAGHGTSSGGPTTGGSTSGGPSNGTGPGQSAPGGGSTPGGQTPSGSGPSSGSENPAGGGPTGVASPGAGGPTSGGSTTGSETPSGSGPTGASGPSAGPPSGGSETPSGSGPSGAEPSGGSLSSSSGGSAPSGSEPSGGSLSSSPGGSESSGGSLSGSSSGGSESGGSLSSSSSESSSGSSSSSSSSSSGESSSGSSSSGGSSSSR